MSPLRYKQPGKPKLGRQALTVLKARRETWPAVKRRSGYRCEMCLERKDLEWCHIVGRPATGLQLGEWANTVELTAALCRECHDGLDRRRPTSIDDQDRIHALLEAASARLAALGAETFCPGYTGATNERQSWHDGIREQIRQLEAAGVEP